MQDERKLAERSLPASVHIEVAVLGAMLLTEAAFSEGSDRLVAEEFSLDSHQRIFRNTLHVRQTFGKVDTLLLQDEMEKRGELSSIGGPSYLAFLTEGIPRNYNIEAYVRIVKDKARLRRVMFLANDLQVEASDGMEDPQHLLERALVEIQQLATGGGEPTLQQVGAYLTEQGDPEQAFEQMAALRGVNLGFTRWDHLTNGLQPKDLIVIGARPSMGKTAWAINVAQNVAVKQGLVVALFSLEQSKASLIRRLLSCSAQVNHRSILRNELSRHEKALLIEHREMLAKAPLYIDDTSGMTATRIRSECARLKARLGRLDLVMVDQLSHVPWTDVYEKGLQPPMLIGRQSKLLKRMAKDLDTPVVVFNQLKRPDGKTEVKPKLSDLKESGSLEEDADVVGFLHRGEYYDKKDESLKGKGLMILAKNREGATGEMDCLYEGTIMRWKDDVATQDSFDDGHDSTW